MSLPDAKFGPIDHREDEPFMNLRVKSLKVVFLCKDSHKTMETVCNIIPPQSTADYHLIGMFDKKFSPRFQWAVSALVIFECLSKKISGPKIINIIDEETEREKWVETKWISWKSPGLFYSQ